jgi:hypothetical protein
MLKSFEKFSKDIQKEMIVYKIPMVDLENLYKYFHISEDYLINDDSEKTFVFTAKVPYQPFTDDDMNIIEDDFTPRVSIAPSIKMCLHALPDEGDSEQLYLYGVDLKNDSSDDIETVNLKEMLDRCPIINGEKYGEDFSLGEWLEALDIKQYREIQKWYYEKTVKDVPDIVGEVKYKDIDLSEFIESPSDLPEKYKMLFYACVPDADTTNEFWSLKNLKMNYLGAFEGYYDEVVILHVKDGEGCT